jgi:hypothetical protein
VAQPESSRPRKTITEPGLYVFQLHAVYAYPTFGGRPINPYLPPKPSTALRRMAPGRVRIDADRWARPRFWLLGLVSRGPGGRSRIGGPRPGDPCWRDPMDPAGGTCNRAHFRKMELIEIGVFPVDPLRVEHFFPHLAPRTAYAINDISIVGGMKIGRIAGASLAAAPRRQTRTDRLPTIADPRQAAEIGFSAIPC